MTGFVGEMIEQKAFEICVLRYPCKSIIEEDNFVSVRNSYGFVEMLGRRPTRSFNPSITVIVRTT